MDEKEIRRIIEKVVGHHQIIDYKLQRDASYICLWSKTCDRPDISVRHKIKLDDYYYFFNSYDRISIYNVCYMMIIFTIKPRHQLDFCVGGI
jgi:hypothetical protein